MAKTVSEIQQEFLVAFSTQLSNPTLMDKLGVGYKAFMDAQKAVDTNGSIVAPLDSTQPYGWLWNHITEESYRLGHNVPTVQMQFRRCVCNGNPRFGGSVLYYLDRNNSTLKEDGSSAATDISGSTGYQVFVEIPKFYTYAYQDGSWNFMWMGIEPFENATTHPNFRNSGWTDSGDGTDSSHEATHDYISAYEGCLYDASATSFINGVDSNDTTSLIDLVNDKIRSVSGLKPWVGITRAEARTLIANGGGKQFSWHQYTAMRYCFNVEYMTHNSQLIIPGYTEYTSGATYTTGVVYTGITNSLGNNSGSITGLASNNGGTSTTSRVIANSYRGVENFFGHLWNWVDGINISNAQPFICNITDTFSDDNFTSPYIRAVDSNGLSITNATSSGYQSVLNAGTYFPKAVGASSLTKITDYYYYASGNTVLRFGGGLNDSASAGVGYLAASSASSVSGWDVCGR